MSGKHLGQFRRSEVLETLWAESHVVVECMAGFAYLDFDGYRVTVHCGRYLVDRYKTGYEVVSVQDEQDFAVEVDFSNDPKGAFKSAVARAARVLGR
jgi:hypothetical protein